MKSIADAFSGGASFAFEAKLRGYEVVTNDILKINYHIAHALIANKNVKLDDSDYEMIFSGTNQEGFIYENFSEVYYFPEECKELDLYRMNISKLDCAYKESLALILMRRAMIRKMPYSRFTIPWKKIVQLRDEEYSYSKYKRRRAYHNESFKSHFDKNLSAYNNAVFDNKRNNQSFNLDVFEFIDTIDVDMVYIDPPYTGTMNNYHGFYGFIDSFIDQEISKPFENSFMNKKDSLLLFDHLFAALSRFKYWMMSYNNTSYPSQEELLNLISIYSENVQVIEREHDYKITGRARKKENIELLFVVQNV